MAVAVIAQDAKIAKRLEKAGFSVLPLEYDLVPSLTGLLLEHPDITDLVIQDTTPAPWSGAHIMSTAKYLLDKGSTVILGCRAIAGQCAACPVITITEEIDALPELLRKAKKGNKSHPSGGTVLPHIEEKNEPKRVHPDPLLIPRGMVIYIGLVGSQPRVGCTTQAISLWHYCKALGFSPAITASPVQIASIAGVMESTPIEQGHMIEGIPFVEDTALAYDCYIMDLGIQPDEVLLELADLTVLVAGSKPWELLSTTAALRALAPQKPCILLSFSTDRDVSVLQPLFDGQPGAAAAWVPDLWKPSAAAFSCFEKMLRPQIERVITKNEPALSQFITP